jgi:hypothetical protein
VSKKNKSNKQSMFDIKPVDKTVVFGFDSQLQTEEDVSLADFLIKEEQKILKQHQNKILKEKEVNKKLNQEIKNEIKSFKNVNSNKYFSEKEIPSRIYLENENKKSFSEDTTKQKNSLIEKFKKREQLKKEALGLEGKVKEKSELIGFVNYKLGKLNKVKNVNKQETDRIFYLSQNTKEEIEFIEDQIKIKKQQLNEIKKTEREEEKKKDRLLEIESNFIKKNNIKESLAFELENINEKIFASRKELKETQDLSQNTKEEIEFVEDQIKIKKQQLTEIKKTEREEKITQIKNNLLSKPFENNYGFEFLKSFLKFSGVSLVIFLLIFGARFFSYGFQIKDEVMVKGASVVENLEEIKNNFQNKDFDELILDFEKIQQDLNQINQNLNKAEGGLPSLITKIPIVSKYGSAKNLLEAGEEISEAMVMAGELAGEFSKIKNPLDFKNDEKKSTGQFFLNLETKTKKIENYLVKANQKIQEVNPSNLPADYQEEVRALKEKFPHILSLTRDFNQKQSIFKDLLGYNGPRKYLFLFQNNQEIRATGGFIGSYGILDIHDGNVKDFFIDGIYNPDGQLYTKVVPPKPIQKISTAWSTHDANWFPNFPDSAQKIAWFYEKTGGPTVDGILTFTPTILEKLLEFTGPIEMPEYDLVINSENFIKSTQTEVEVNYDKEDNKPKQIIADLTPKIVEKLFSEDSLRDFPRLISILSDSLTEKHLLIYLENSDIQKTVSDLGWSGEVLQSPKDYLMVVNSNINGYKTDGVVDQKIDHKIEIEEDGSLTDTVTIERVHNGGSTGYEWWDQVNANYMRVYVPLGSELLEARGHTLETVESPVNYDKLGFIRDNLVENLENSIKIDQESQTEIWEEAGKTVFGNWVYVSPQEKVKVTYKYKLPFRLEVDSEINKMDNYSVLYQKQSGMNTSELKSEIFLPNNREVFWQYPKDVQSDKNLLKYITNLERDRFLGVVIK